MSNLRLLLVEDSEGDAGLIVRVLTQAGFEVAFRRVDDADGLRHALDNSAWDVIVADYRLPAFDAPGVLRMLREWGEDIPCIVVSGEMGEETAVAMMKAGARDYLTKNNLARLAPAVYRELTEAAERRRSRRCPRGIVASRRAPGLSRRGHAVRHVRLSSPERQARLVK